MSGTGGRGQGPGGAGAGSAGASPSGASRGAAAGSLLLAAHALPGAPPQGQVATLPPRARRPGRLAAAVGLVALLVWSGWLIELRPLELLDGAANIHAFLEGYLHPSVANLGTYVRECAVTAAIALWGTLLAVLLSIPLGLLGARNVSPTPLLYQLARRTMDLFRAVNEFVLALMFVAAVGLGPFAGMLALGIHTAGVLGKLLSETIEAVDPGQVEGVAATGASGLQVVAFGVVPQVLPNYLSYVLLRFESDIRSASVIGLVGGGGIGFHLWETIRSFQDREAATVILLIVAMVMATDAVSARIRRTFI